MARDAVADTRQAAFLAALERGLSVTGAAAAAGIDRGLAYTWREEDPDFAAAWRMAAQAGADLLEDEALRRAMQGVEKPVFYRGEQVGTVRVYNDRLLMWLLQRRQSAALPAGQDLRKALEKADAFGKEMIDRLDSANERIAQLSRELAEARQGPDSPGLREDVQPVAAKKEEKKAKKLAGDDTMPDAGLSVPFANSLKGGTILSGRNMWPFPAKAQDYPERMVEASGKALLQTVHSLLDRGHVRPSTRRAFPHDPIALRPERAKAWRSVIMTGAPA